MKLRSISMLPVALLIGLFLGTVHVKIVDAEEIAELGCSNKMLHGYYGFYRAGGTSTGPLPAVGIVFYDGNGNNIATQSVSKNGVFTLDQTTFGQYEVAADCTGKGFLNGVEISRNVVVDRGKEIYLFSENTGNTVYGVAKKIRGAGIGD